jgi:2-succinyl-6-hydroxy-2,4-cyclohexadiene-1-carboxylate synthase
MTVFYPHRFERVIIESASPGIKEDRDRKIRMQNEAEISRMLTSINYETFLNLWYRQPIFGDLNQRDDFSLLIKTMQNNPLQLAYALRQLSVARQPELWSHLKDIKIPLCLLTGKKDVKFTSIASKMTKTNPSIIHNIVKGAAHTVHFEAPEEVINAIYAFFTAKKN